MRSQAERTNCPTRFGCVPRFYLHLCNGSGFTEDEEGQEFRDTEHAYREAVRGLRDVMTGELMRGEMNLGSFIEIENERHELIRRVDFSEAVRVSNNRGQRPSGG